jgi:tetrahydromethanopterin S-methyltransferase subunit G
MGDLIGLVAVVLIFGGPMFALWTRYRLEHERLRQEKSDKAFEQLRQELAQVRETSTQYALSFEDALQRMERRLDSLEQRVSAVEAQFSYKTGCEVATMSGWDACCYGICSVSGVGGSADAGCTGAVDSQSLFAQGQD